MPLFVIVIIIRCAFATFNTASSSRLTSWTFYSVKLVLTVAGLDSHTNHTNWDISHILHCLHQSTPTRYTGQTDGKTAAQTSNDILNCCALWANSLAMSCTSWRASLLGKFKAAFLVIMASCLRWAHSWLLTDNISWLASWFLASLHKVFTSLWPTIMTSLLWEMNFSGGWPSFRLLINTLMAFWIAPKYSRQWSEMEGFLEVWTGVQGLTDCDLETCFFKVSPFLFDLRLLFAGFSCLSNSVLVC